MVTPAGSSAPRTGCDGGMVNAKHEPDRNARAQPLRMVILRLRRAKGFSERFLTPRSPDLIGLTLARSLPGIASTVHPRGPAFPALAKESLHANAFAPLARPGPPGGPPAGAVGRGKA